jgi:hypothetical protein
MTVEQQQIAHQPPRGQELPLPIQLRPERATPVYGTAQPALGLAAKLRRQAYLLPSHDPKHWLLLLAADRAATAAALAGEAFRPGEQRLVLRHFGRQARSYLKSFPAAAAVLAGLLLWSRARRRGRRFGS